MRAALALTAALLVPAGLAAPAIPGILPAESVLVIGTPDATALREGFQRSSLFALWRDADMQAFVAPLAAEVTGATASLPAPLAMSVDEFFALFPRQVYAGISHFAPATSPGGAAGPDIGVFIAAETQQPQRVLEIIDALIARTGAEQSRDTYTEQDVTVARNVLTFQRPSALPGEPGQEPGLDLATSEESVTLHTAVVDGLVIATIDEPLGPVIANLRSGSGGFARGTAVTSTSAMAGSTAHQFVLHVNPAPVHSTLTQLATAGSPFNPAALGISDIQGLSMWLDFGPETADSWFALSLSPNPVGLGRLLRHGTASDFPALDWVPANAVTFSAMGYDLGATVTDAIALITSVSPLAGGFLTGMMSTASQSLQFDIQGDLLSQLGREYVSYTVTDPAAAPGAFAGAQVYILGLRDAARVAGALARLAQPAVVGANQMAGGGMLEAEEYLGQTIYTPQAVFEGPAGADGVPAFAVVSDHLVIATGAAEMRAVISASQGQIEESVRQSERWAEIQRLAVAGANSFSYSDDAAAMAWAAQGLAQLGLISVMYPDIQIPLDFARVPGPDVFERHLTHTVSTGVMSERGWVSHTVTPNHD